MDLEYTITSFLDDILEDSDFMNNLSQLKSTIKGKIRILNLTLGFSFVVTLIAEWPVYSHHVSKWVQFSVGILAHADNIDNKNPNLLINYLHRALSVIDRVCVYHIADMDFHMSFCMEIEDNWEIIINHGDGIKNLSSYIFCPINNLFVSCKGKLFRIEKFKTLKGSGFISVANLVHKWLVCLIFHYIQELPRRKFSM